MAQYRYFPMGWFLGICMVRVFELWDRPLTSRALLGR